MIPKNYKKLPGDNPSVLVGFDNDEWSFEKKRLDEGEIKRCFGHKSNKIANVYENEGREQ